MLYKTLKYSKLMIEPNVKGRCVSKQFSISKNEKPATFYITEDRPHVIHYCNGYTTTKPATRL